MTILEDGHILLNDYESRGYRQSRIYSQSNRWILGNRVLWFTGPMSARLCRFDGTTYHVIEQFRFLQ
jgi:hypothetical protein